MFRISPNDPTDLTLLGHPVAIPGDFPNTVAASAQHNLVCVGTTGVQAGISCSSFSANGLGAFDALRPFNLDQTTVPSGPFNTVSDTFFSEDESRLYTTVKGNPTTNNTGFFSVYPVEGGGRSPAKVSTQGIQSSPSGTAVLFGSVVIPGLFDNVFVTDPTFGAAIVNIDPITNLARTVLKVPIAGQAATCWSTFSASRYSIFVADAGLNRLVEMSAFDASILQITDFTNGNTGLFDLIAAGEFVYALSPGTGSIAAAVIVFNAAIGQQVQNFDVSSYGANSNAQGMAVFL